jgi:hypothetical protein
MQHEVLKPDIMAEGNRQQGGGQHQTAGNHQVDALRPAGQPAQAQDDNDAKHCANPGTP